MMNIFNKTNLILLISILLLILGLIFTIYNLIIENIIDISSIIILIFGIIIFILTIIYRNHLKGFL